MVGVQLKKNVNSFIFATSQSVLRAPFTPTSKWVWISKNDRGHTHFQSRAWIPFPPILFCKNWYDKVLRHLDSHHHDFKLKWLKLCLLYVFSLTDLRLRSLVTVSNVIIELQMDIMKMSGLHRMGTSHDVRTCKNYLYFFVHLSPPG